MCGRKANEETPFWGPPKKDTHLSSKQRVQTCSPDSAAPETNSYWPFWLVRPGLTGIVAQPMLLEMVCLEQPGFSSRHLLVSQVLTLHTVEKIPLVHCLGVGQTPLFSCKAGSSPSDAWEPAPGLYRGVTNKIDLGCWIFNL